MAHKFWLVAADGSRARFFRGTSPNKELEEFKVLDNPTTRQAGREITTDGPGQFRNDASRGDRMETGQSSTEPRVKENEMAKFAKRVASELDSAASQGEFTHLSVIAEPKFLGNLRKSLDDGTREKIIEEINKNLVEAEQEQLRARLEKLPSGFK